jgi:broad specificity phosphatase PhoE
MQSASQPRYIFLVRHYAPDVERSGFFNAKEATSFLAAYYAANLIKAPFNHPTGLPKKVNKVYCSMLPRSIQTAVLLFGEEVELVQNEEFNEFQRRIFRLPLLKFPIEVWLAGARLLWMLGLNDHGIESFKEARQRARVCAENLANHAEIEHEVILVAHGFLNAFIRRALKKLGWIVINQSGNGYLGVTELIKTDNLKP